MSGLLNGQPVVQIAFLVENIEESCRLFSELLGVEATPCVDAGDYSTTQTVLDGQPAPDANCLMAFLNAGNGLSIELIQPNEKPSVWREYMDKHGPGFHHIAFCTENMEKSIELCEKANMRLRQRGRYRDGSGEYAYLDAAKTLHTYIELLAQF